MPYLVITKHDGDNLTLVSPELSPQQAEQQETYVLENMVSHHVRQTDEEGTETRTTLKAESPGTPGVILELGWIEILSDAVKDVEISQESPEA